MKSATRKAVANIRRQKWSPNVAGICGGDGPTSATNLASTPIRPRSPARRQIADSGYGFRTACGGPESRQHSRSR